MSKTPMPKTVGRRPLDGSYDPYEEWVKENEDEFFKEKAGWNNAQGYLFMLSRLMVSVAQASLKRDLQQYLDLSLELEALLCPWYKEEERKDNLKKFDNIQKWINAYNHYNHNNVERKASQAFNHTKRMLDLLKRDMILRMKEKGLLIPTNIVDPGSATINAEY